MPTGSPRKRESLTAVWLRIMGTVVLLLVVVPGAVFVISRTGKEAYEAMAPFKEFAEFALYLAAGMACAGLLVGLSALLRILRDLHASFTRLERYQYELKETTEAAAEITRTGALISTAGDSNLDESHAMPPAAWRELLSVLEDIRDNSLLSHQERAEKQQRIADEAILDATARIRELTAAGEYGRTREIAEAISRKYPNDERVSELVEEVEQSREKHEDEDVRACTKQVNDLISISAWGRARELAHQLQQRHPNSVDARRLLLRIEREHGEFENEQRRRMSAEVQRFVSRRRWEEALAVARTFIERFPGCEESEGLRMELPTLEGNAEIEARQRLEARIMEYARNGRYIEAVDLARKVIEEYPDSPQAEALRSQLERLEELADKPDAPPARVRG